MMLVYLIISIFFLWNIVLTVVYISALRHYKQLKSESLEFSISEILKSLIKRAVLSEKNFEDLKKEVESLEMSNIKNISRVGLVRFNPYDDTGGDLSFSLALLDKDKNGVVLSSLHGRGGTRIYCKNIKSGQKDRYELSQEEKDSLSEALR